VILAMTRRGVRIDLGRVAEAEARTEVKEREALGAIKMLTGVSIELGDIWKKGPVTEALDVAGIKYGLTAKMKQPKIDDELLSSVADPTQMPDELNPNPTPAQRQLAGAVLRARKVNKIRTTFCASIRDHMVGETLHCGFAQMKRGDGGARTGRLSSSHPNLQQVPGTRNKDFREEAELLRRVFVPERGALWASLDYSQQEVRIALHFAHRAGCVGAAKAVEKYRQDKKMDFHSWMAGVTQLRRNAPLRNVIVTTPLLPFA